jgi:hypothetical protein
MTISYPANLFSAIVFHFFSRFSLSTFNLDWAGLLQRHNLTGHNLKNWKKAQFSPRFLIFPDPLLVMLTDG